MTAAEATARERCRRLGLMLDARPERHDQELYLDAKPENECGTVGCVAGWGRLWSDGLVDIGPDGHMSWSSDLGNAVGTWFGSHGIAKKWLSLEEQAAHHLFLTTLDYTFSEDGDDVARGPERLAVAVLAAIGAGTLGVRRDDRLTFTDGDLYRVALWIGIRSWSNEDDEL